MSLEDYMEVQHNNFEASSASKSGSNSSKYKLPTKYPYKLKHLYRFFKDFLLLNSHTVLDIHQKMSHWPKIVNFLAPACLLPGCS